MHEVMVWWSILRWPACARWPLVHPYDWDCDQFLEPAL